MVEVAPASAIPVTRDIAVVRTDSGVYWNSYNSAASWGSWASLSGSTPSPPGICQSAGSSTVVAIVRGTDNGIYTKYSSAGTWSSSWVSPPGGGATIDTPACAYLPGVFYVVVRGVGNELYWNSYNGVSWSGWVDLHGQSASAPVLLSSPSPLSRLDLVVQGTDNGIYHKAYTSGAWSSSWDSPGGATSSKPAAALITLVDGCPSACAETDYLFVLVRGTDNNVYYSQDVIAYKYNVYPPDWSVWNSWYSGSTLSAPTLAYAANSCPPGTIPPSGSCESDAEFVVRGSDNAVYHGQFSVAGWNSPGGSITNSPALAYLPGISCCYFVLLVEGYPSTNLYSNTVGGSSWGTFQTVDSGSTNSDPQLVAVV